MLKKELNIRIDSQKLRRFSDSPKEKQNINAVNARIFKVFISFRLIFGQNYPDIVLMDRRVA